MQQDNKAHYVADWDALDEEQARVEEPRRPEPTQAPPSSGRGSPAQTAGETDSSRSEDDEAESDAPLFPCWKLPEHFPAAFARSGLFSVERLARKSADAEPWIDSEIKAAGARMRVKGPRLSMNDKELFEELVFRAKRKKLPLDRPLAAPLASLARSLGWRSEGGDALRWIADSARRLSQCEVTYESNDGKVRFEGRMLASAAQTPDALSVSFDPALVQGAFGQGQQFKLDRVRRRTLKRPLARWLHDFLGTHTKRSAIDLPYLRRISGYEVNEPGSEEERRQRREFPGMLREACEELRLRAPGVTDGLEIDKQEARASSGWKATFKAGSEKPKFENAEKFAPPKKAEPRASL